MLGAVVGAGDEIGSLFDGLVDFTLMCGGIVGTSVPVLNDEADGDGSAVVVYVVGRVDGGGV